MSEDMHMTGGCLCGAVRFEAVPKNLEVGACHCGMCRRWSGGVFLVVDCGANIKFENEDNIEKYKSSEWGERGFCKKCGTSLFWKMQDKGQYYLSAAALDNQDRLNFSHEIFVDEKPDYYSFANETHKMTGAEVFAAFADDNKDE